jgi:pilus assembly protein CpaE
MANLALDQSSEETPRTPDPAEIRPAPRISLQAFCETGDLAAAVEAAGGDRRMARAHVKVQMGGLPAAVEAYGTSPTPNLVVIETRQVGEKLFAELERLAHVCDPGTKVVLIGHVNDIQLYRELMRRGVSEYLTMPVPVLSIIRAVSDLYADPSSEPLGRSIAFIGAKGGTGSSMVAHNVAWSIARRFSNDVVLADLDLAFGTAGLDFNQDPSQGIADAVHAPERLDDTFLERLLARCTDHLNLLAAPATLDRTYDFEEQVFEGIIDVAQGGVPAVVLDVPHVWTAWAKKTLLAADEVVITAEPDLANLRNAKNLIDLLKAARRNDSPPRLVLNKVGMTKRPEIKPDEFVASLGIGLDATIPFDAQLFGTAANNGQMIAETDAKSPVANAFVEIAQIVTGRTETRRPRRSGLASMLAKLRGKAAPAA